MFCLYLILNWELGNLSYCWMPLLQIFYCVVPADCGNTWKDCSLMDDTLTYLRSCGGFNLVVSHDEHDLFIMWGNALIHPHTTMTSVPPPPLPPLRRIEVQHRIKIQVAHDLLLVDYTMNSNAGKEHENHDIASLSLLSIACWVKHKNLVACCLLP